MTSDLDRIFMVVKQGVILGQYFDHKGLLEIYVHYASGLFLFASGLLAAALLWRKFRGRRQGWEPLRVGIIMIGLVGLGEALEHSFAGRLHDVFHYLHMVAAPLGIFLIYVSLLELEMLYFEGKEKTVIPRGGKTLLTLLGVTTVAILGSISGLPWDASIERPFLFVTTIPMMVITYLAVTRAIHLYRQQHDLSLLNLSIFSTVMAMVPLIAVGTVLLSLDILAGRVVDQFADASAYVATHVMLDILLTSVGAMLLSSSVMLIMSPDLNSLQEQLIKAAKTLTLGELTSDITYQLDKPLSRISELAETALRSEKVDGQLQRDLEKVLRESINAVELARKLSEFSHDERPHFQITNLKSVIDDALSFMELRMRHGGVRLVKKLQKPLPHVSVDRIQMRQVFIDIINNELNTLTRGGQIGITAFSQDGWVAVGFRDNGRFNASEKVERLYEPLGNGPATGNGIGLALAYSVVESHDGRIEAQSDPEQGTNIIVRLPIVSDELVNTSRQDARQAAEDGAGV